MDGTSDEGLRSLHKALDRLQDELMAADPRQKRRDIDILREIDTIEALIEEHEPDDTPEEQEWRSWAEGER